MQSERCLSHHGNRHELTTTVFLPPYLLHQVSIETGRIGLQANGAVMVTEGETVLYTTICAGREITADGGFVPLTVNYQERFSAAGKTAGGYRKRDGGVRENETLIGRLVDRPLRPMIPKVGKYGYKPFVLINRSTHHVKPFYLSSETVLPIT